VGLTSPARRPRTLPHRIRQRGIALAHERLATRPEPPLSPPCRGHRGLRLACPGRAAPGVAFVGWVWLGRVGSLRAANVPLQEFPPCQQTRKWRAPQSALFRFVAIARGRRRAQVEVNGCVLDSRFRTADRGQERVISRGVFGV